MTAKDLKNAILQLAVQGKLVSQDKNDQSVEDLVACLHAHKQYLLDNNLITIDKKHTVEPFADDDVPFEIPKTWKWMKFADIVNFSSGKTPARQDISSWSAVEYPWVSISDMVDGEITNATAEKISRSALEKYFSGKLIPKGTIIMSFKLTIGKISYLGIDAVHNEAIINILPYATGEAERILKAYLFNILPLIANSGEFKNAVKGKTLNATSISNLYVPLPPLEEQERIVAKIEELMPLVEEYGNAEKELFALNAEFPEQLRKSILQLAIQGKLVPQEPTDEPASVLLEKIRAEKKAKLGKKYVDSFIYKGDDNCYYEHIDCVAEDKPVEVPFDLPDGWAWCKIKEFGDVLGGKRIPAGRKLSDDNNGHIYIKVSDMKNGSVNTDKLQYVPDDIFMSISRYIIKKEDIYITVAGTIGQVGIIPAELDGANLTENADRIVFRRLNQKWLLKCLESNVVQTQIIAATTKVGQPKLAIARIQEFLIPLPPLAEQQRIVARIEELLTSCKQLEKNELL